MVKTTMGVLGQIETLSYWWEGGSLAYMPDLELYRNHIDGCKLRQGQVVSLGPLRLRLIDRDYGYGAWLVERDSWRAWLRSKWWPMLHRFDWVYRRFVVTLSLWHLAEYQEAAIPTWRDVYLLRTIAKLVGGRKV